MDVLGNLEVRWVQGFSSSNVEFVDKTTACYRCGNYIVFLNFETSTRKVLQCPGHSLGVFTANEHNKRLAVSEQKRHPSIFVYGYPELSLISELKGIAKLSYTALALSDVGPYLASCSSLPDYTITVWNCESGIAICSHSQAEEDITALVFNPKNWQQICAANSKSLTIWHIERSKDFHLMKPSFIHLPATDGSIMEREVNQSHFTNGKLTYFGPQMPSSSIAWLTDDRADNFVPLQLIKPRLCPSAICWSVLSDLYIGSREGFLLLVNPETLHVSVLCRPYNETPLGGSEHLAVKEGSFQSLALNNNGVFAAGTDGVLRNLQIKGNQVQVVETLALEEPVSTLRCSADYETLLLSSASGCIYKYNPCLTKNTVKVLDVRSGNFMVAAPVYTEKNLCVSVKESGELQLWSLDDGLFVGSISLQTNVTSMACCPIAQYVAVGTVTGHVLFVDLTMPQQPRLVHRAHLYHVPIDHLVFDQGGNFLFTGASDIHIFVLDARPSKAFGVIGYTDVLGTTVSLSTQYHKESKHVKILVLCKARENDEKNKEGNLLLLLSLSVQHISGTPNCVDHCGCLLKDVVYSSAYQIPQAISSCVLCTNKVFGYCHQLKVLQRFQLPESVDKSPNTEEPVLMNPDQEVIGHPLGPASVYLSLHQTWLASAGRDGLICIYEASTMERYVQMQCHSCWLGGVRSVSFTPDSQTLLITGVGDGALICSSLRLQESGVASENAAAKSLMAPFEDIISKENSVLTDMAKREPQLQTQTEEVSEQGQTISDITDSKENYTSLPSATRSNSTWLENKLDAVLKEESQQFEEARKSLKKSMKELQDAIQSMIKENEILPDIEKLDQKEFNLDMEEQLRLQAEGEQEVTKVRNEIELENLAKCYQCDIIKLECWDSMMVKAKSIKAFLSDTEVINFPMKERTAKELEELHRVETLRKIEQADSNLQQDLLEKIKPLDESDEEKDDEGQEAESPALTGSLSAEYGGSNCYLYSQFNLHMREQKINQILLIQDIIYKIKIAFNSEFEALHKQKEQELNRVTDKNKRIIEIMTELGIQENLWVPILTDNEMPERVLTVSDSEIKVEKYLTPEQKQREEEQRRKEEQMRLAAKGDNIRERALGDMMGGVLEVKKEDILRMEVPQPEFLAKPEVEWTDEEKRIYKEYEKKTKALREEQDKYRKILETEMKKLHAFTKESTQTFDETLGKLFKRKLKSEAVIYQEELKIANLAFSLLTEEELLNREKDLNYRIENIQTQKNEVRKALQKHREDVEAFQEAYDITVAEDKLLDKAFRKEFSDVSGPIVDQLYKLYKRRPRIQQMRTQTDTTSLFREPVLGQATAEGFLRMMKAMMELDALENMPEGLDPSVWERFCLSRRTKVESEQQIKVKALMLAEVQAFLQKRTDEYETAVIKIKNLTDELNGLREEKTRFCLDTLVQILLKQGQVEMETEDLLADYSDALLIHRSVVEDLNHTIRTLADQKIASMVECKDFRKGIIQQMWEHKSMSMQIEDLHNKAKDIQMMHITQELQEYLNEKDQEKRISTKVSNLKKAIIFLRQIHEKNVENCKKLIKQLNRQAAQKEEKNAALDMQLTSLQVTVAERKNVFGTTAMEVEHEQEIEERYQKILQRKKLMDLIKEQAEEIAILSNELERMRIKSFPAFSPPD